MTLLIAIVLLVPQFPISETATVGVSSGEGLAPAAWPVGTRIGAGWMLRGLANDCHRRFNV